jgi:hypothetical protein
LEAELEDGLIMDFYSDPAILGRILAYRRFSVEMLNKALGMVLHMPGELFISPGQNFEDEIKQVLTERSDHALPELLQTLLHALKSL